jgi:hypothetical protein
MGDQVTALGGYFDLHNSNGKEYIRVSSTIYVYSGNMTLSQVQDHAKKVQDAINSYWNNPEDAGDGKLGKAGGLTRGLNVVFDVTVIGVSTSDARDIIDNASAQDIRPILL